MEDRVSIHFSVEDGIIEVEQKKGPLTSQGKKFRGTSF